MEKQIWKPGTLLAPVPPVLVSCGSIEQPNALTIGWTGIINTIPPMTYISVRPERFSHSIIKESGEFVINLPTKQLVRAVDFCGVRSGRTVNKFEHCKLTALPASQISAPIIGESPVSLECKVEQVISLGSHDMFIAKTYKKTPTHQLYKIVEVDDKGNMELIHERQDSNNEM